MSDPRDDDRRNDKGSVMVVAALALVALVLFAALAVDVGFIWSSRTQSQNVSDSAAIAAAQTMIVPDPDTGPVALKFDKVAATNKGVQYAALNSTVANPSVVVQPTDFEFGNWNLATRTLEPGVETNPDSMTAVRVDVRMDGTDNNQSPGLLSRLLQKSDGSRPFAQGFQVENTAVAYLGFQGHFDPGYFDLPVAVDSCELTSGGGCGTDFCTKVESPTACTLLSPQSDSVGLICGVMHDTGNQNMCWTAFSDKTNNPLIKDVIDNGNPGDVEAGDAVDIDNGTKTSSLDYLRDKMYGCGKFTTAAGEKLYGSTYAVDSWVVKLPVVECQDTRHCAGGPPAEITGGVCFEIREIVEPSPGKACNAPTSGGDKIIKGRALCPNSTNPTIQALYKAHCETPLGGSVDPGGCGFGLRANRVVLVD
jgi:Flp pilus assembly protein TadG